MDGSAMISSLAMPNIEALSMYASSNKVQESVSTAMLSNALDIFEANGAAIRNMMELSVNPEVGGNIDISL